MDDAKEKESLAVLAVELKSLHQLSALNFKAVNEKLEALQGLPVAFERLKGYVDAAKREVDGRLDNIEDDVKAMKDRDVRGAEWRRGQVPMFVASFLLVLVSIIQVVGLWH